MRTERMINPNTNREIKVRTWQIVPREICAMLKDGRIKSAKDLSLMLLSDDEAIKAMESEQYGDSADSNFALGVFENALDWALGLKVINLISAYVKAGKLPKPFKLAASKKGDVFVLMPSGRIF